MPASPPAGAAAPWPQDATARVVEAWHRERPDLDPSPLDVFSRVTRLAKYLDQMRGNVFERHGLQTWEFDVLAELRRSGAPYELTPGQMAAQMLISSGTMTNRLHRLEAAGLVTRRDNPQDRRVSRARLTRAGRERIDAAIDDLVSLERDLLEGVPEASRRAVAATLATVLQPLETTVRAEKPSERPPGAA